MKFFGRMFSDNEGNPSVARLLSLMFGVTACVYAFLERGNLEKFDLWLILSLALIAMIGKNVQKVIEVIVEKYNKLKGV